MTLSEETSMRTIFILIFVLFIQENCKKISNFKHFLTKIFSGGCNDLENAVNKYRAEKGLHPLKCDEELRKISQYHAYDYFVTNKKSGKAFKPGCGHGWFQSRFTCGQKCCSRCFQKQANCVLGFNSKWVTSWKSWGENSAWHSRKMTPQLAVNQWKNSTFHQKQMVKNEQFIGCYAFKTFGVCNFGSQFSF